MEKSKGLFIYNQFRLLLGSERSNLQLARKPYIETIH